MAYKLLKISIIFVPPKPAPIITTHSLKLFMLFALTHVVMRKIIAVTHKYAWFDSFYEYDIHCNNP